MIAAAQRTSSRLTIDRLRNLLLVLTAFGLVGLGAELFLLEHTEGRAQKVPLVAIGVGLAATVWFGWSGSARSRVAYRWIMMGLVAAAAAGLYFHFTGNLEFELELQPAASGIELYREVLFGATPALAPGALAQIGLTGLIASFLGSRPAD